MTNVTFSSILVENKKNNNAEGRRIIQTQSGIDFKNDTVIVNAQNDVDYAKGIENSRNNDAVTTKMSLAHIDKEFSTDLAKYTNTLSLQEVAKATSEQLATTQKNTVEQLAQSNAKVANLTAQQANQALAISNLKTEQNTLSQQKAYAVDAANAKIDSTKSAISSLSANRNNLSGNLSNLNNQLSAIQDTDPEAETKRAQLRASINSCKSQIADLEAQIAAKRNELNQAEAAKAETTARYDALLSAKASQIAKAENEHKTTTNNLAQEVYTQTGLNLKAALEASKVVEAQLFETSVANLLKSLTAKLTKTEANKTKTTEKLDEQETIHEEASNTTKTKETILEEKSAQTKSAYDKKEKETNFLA